MKIISPCLWFNNEAEKAAQFYSSIFKNSKIGKTARYSEASAQVSGREAGSVMTVEFELEGLKILGLNGGSHFKFSPAHSFFVSCDSVQEIEEKWKKLSEGGTVRMALDKYPWAEKYGWTADQFGVEWQLMLSSRETKIAPALLFVDKLFGKGEEAINFYMSLFENSKINFIHRDEKTNHVMHCAFTLAGQGFVVMDGPGEHGYTFTPATSFMVSCEDQTQIDNYWNKLSEGGEAQRCGWLTDKFGVSWQIIPAIMSELMANPAKAQRVMTAILKMKKLDIAAIKAAADSVN